MCPGTFLRTFRPFYVHSGPDAGKSSLTFSLEVRSGTDLHPGFVFEGPDIIVGDSGVVCRGCFPSPPFVDSPISLHLCCRLVIHGGHLSSH